MRSCVAVFHESCPEAFLISPWVLIWSKVFCLTCLSVQLQAIELLRCSMKLASQKKGALPLLLHCHLLFDVILLSKGHWELILLLILLFLSM